MPELDAPPHSNAAAATTVLQRAAELAACTEEPGRLTRRFATPALAQAGELVAGWMRQAGMRVRRDPIGNVVGRWEPPSGARPPGAPGPPPRGGGGGGGAAPPRGGGPPPPPARRPPPRRRGPARLRR